jgi:hypothetical protein
LTIVKVVEALARVVLPSDTVVVLVASPAQVAAGTKQPAEYSVFRPGSMTTRALLVQITVPQADIIVVVT